MTQDAFGMSLELVRLLNLYFSKVNNIICRGRRTSDAFPIQNGLKEDALSAFLFNFVLECAIRKVEDNWEGLVTDGTHQLLVCAACVNLLGGNIKSTKNQKLQ
jgi:hypothetical protein